MMTSAPVLDPSRKVFLVEDNADMREVLTQQLRLDGFDVCPASTMRDALAGFHSFGSHILVSDVGLPDGDGWQLLRSLRQDGSLPYAIAMSGFGTLADIAQSHAAGYQHHLVKPIDLDALEQLLEQAIPNPEQRNDG